MNILFDSILSDTVRRYRIYNGDIFVFSPRPSSVALCNLAREMIEEAFGSSNPEEAQHHLPVEEFVAILAPLKPKFIHHPESRRLIQGVLAEVNCDMEKSYLDVPRLRAVTHGGYLTSGVGYAHHPHRDTWYSAPMCQLNWWLPICPFQPESSMAFHPHYWSCAVKNGSTEFNYYQWNADGRKNAAQHIRTDTRKQPKPEEPMELDPQVRMVCEPGGIIIFSAAQMHSTVPNTSGRTRFSLDFRTIHLDDAASMSGAANIDSAPTGTSLRDFMRASDLERVPNEVVRLYESEEPVAEAVVFRPEQAEGMRQ